jgi:hypothetical protein
LRCAGSHCRRQKRLRSVIGYLPPSERASRGDGNRIR